MTEPADLLTLVSDEKPPGLAGMTVGQAVSYMLLGDRRHSDAPPEECGAVDPRDPAERKWCRRPNDGRCKRDGSHCCYRLDEDWP